MQVNNNIYDATLFILQRNSQGLHGSKHRKHRRGSRKHSKSGNEKGPSSAIEALAEASHSIILDSAELPAEDGRYLVVK